MLRRMMLVCGINAIALTMFAGSASAAPKGDPFDFTLPAGETCQFPVNFKGTSAQRDRLPNNPEVDIVTGNAVVTVTNTTNQKSARYNISGPIKTRGSQTVITGPQLVLLLAENAPPGPGLLYTKGHGIIENNRLDVANFKGQILDVCEVLT